MDWATPWSLFRLIEKHFGPFTLDPCATATNAKCPRFFTEDDNGLAKSWEYERVFLNPPYGREAPEWVEKAFCETRKSCALVVALLAPRTDTEWWHRYVGEADEIWFLKGRVTFEDPTTGKRFSPQDPSCLIVWRSDYFGTKLPYHASRSDNPPKVVFWNWKTELID